MADKVLSVVIVGNEAKYVKAIQSSVTATNKLEQATKSASNTSSTVGDQATKSLTKAADSTSLLSRGLTGVGNLAKDAAGAFTGFLAASAVIASVTRVFSVLSSAVLDFDRNMRNVNSLLGQSDAGFAKMGDAVLGLSRELPQSASALSAGLYDVVSSGFEGADALSVLRASAVAASAGLTDTATSGRAISGVLNAYGLSAAHAGEVSDTLFQTVNLGVITFEELAGTIGDFVGTAAALGVPIDDAASALATMTLSGISAEESSTALNRVMLALIKPTTQMAALFKSWGFESGTAAVQALGLRGVMDRIRESTGGTADSMQGLFEETRGLKGALALVSDEGRNYARVAAGMGEAHKGAGAAAKVLAEQSKSLSFQLALLKNNAVAAGIELGRAIGPTIAKGLSLIRDVSRDVGAALVAMWKGAQPGIKAVGDALSDVGSIFGDLLDAVGPIAGAFAKIAAGSVVATFNGLAKAVSATTGFLKDHSYLVIAVGALYAGQLAQGIAATVVQLGRLAAANAAGAISNLAGTATTAVGAFRAIQSQMIATGVASTGLGSALAAAKSIFLEFATVGGVAGTVALVGLAAAFYANSQAIKKANEEAGASIDRLFERFDETKSEGIFKLSKSLGRGVDEILAAGDRAKTGGKNVERALANINPFADNSLQRDAAQAEKTIAAMERVGQARFNLEKNLRTVAKGTGIKGFFEPIIDEIDATGRIIGSKLAPTAKVFEQFARTLGEDLTKSGPKAREAAIRVGEALDVLGKQAGYTKDQLNQGFFDPETLTAEAAAAKAFSDSVSKSFSDVGDILAFDFGDNLNGASIIQFYTDTIAATDEFTANIAKAYELGLDPGLISRLLVAGPKEAGELLKTLVSEQGAGFIEQVNNFESAIRQQSQVATEIARLQQRALLPENTDTIASFLPNAIRIAGEKAKQGAASSVESIAAALKLTPSQVAEIAGSYNIDLPGGPRTTVNVDTLVAEVKIKDLKAALAVIPPEVTTTPKIDDPEAVKTWWNDLKERLLLIPGIRETVAKIDDPQQALVFWQALQAKVTGVPQNWQTTYRVNADTSAFDAAIERIRRTAGEVVSVPVVGSGNLRRNAEGNILDGRGNVRRFADGGHYAQIDRSRVTRIWAEPETGGEAYIPLAKSKRARSARILMAVADEFGMSFANGGITGRRVQASSMSSNTQNVTNVNATVIDRKGDGVQTLVDEFAWLRVTGRI